MTSFNRTAFTSIQPETASTASKPTARPCEKATATSIQEASDVVSHFEALDMESEDECLDIMPFTIKCAETTAVSKKQDKPSTAVHRSYAQVYSKPTPQATRVSVTFTPRAIPPVCKTAFCPVNVMEFHLAKPYRRDGFDLPDMVQYWQAHVATMTAQKKCPVSHIVNALDKFYTLHGTVGNFDVPTQAEVAASQSVREGRSDINEGSAVDKGIITVTRLYPFKGFPDVQRMSLRPGKQASNPNNEIIRSSVVKGNSNTMVKSTAATKGNDTKSNNDSAVDTEVVSEGQNVVCDPMAW